MHALFKWDERISWWQGLFSTAVNYDTSVTGDLEESSFSLDEFCPKAQEDRIPCDLDDSCGSQTIWVGAFIPAGSVSVPFLGVGSPACGGDEVWAGSLRAHLERRHLGCEGAAGPKCGLKAPGSRVQESWGSSATGPFLSPRMPSMQSDTQSAVTVTALGGMLCWRSQCADGTWSQGGTSHCGTIYSQGGRSTLWTQTALSTSSMRRQTRRRKSFGIWALNA